jgi:hypothetical protein
MAVQVLLVGCKHAGSGLTTKRQRQSLRPRFSLSDVADNPPLPPVLSLVMKGGCATLVERTAASDKLKAAVLHICSSSAAKHTASQASRIHRLGKGYGWVLAFIDVILSPAQPTSPHSPAPKQGRTAVKSYCDRGEVCSARLVVRCALGALHPAG